MRLNLFVYFLQEVNKRKAQSRANITQVNRIDLPVPTFPFLDVSMGLTNLIADLSHGQASNLPLLFEALDHKLIFRTMDRKCYSASPKSEHKAVSLLFPYRVICILIWMSIQQPVLSETSLDGIASDGTHPHGAMDHYSLPLVSGDFFLPSGVYCARLIDSADEDAVRAYQSLRYECFVERKGWVKDDPSNPGLEIDHYDPHCYHLGVFQETLGGLQLVAYLRALPWQEHPGLMLQHEFDDLVSPAAVGRLAQTGNVEISRLVVAPLPGSDRSSSLAIAELLFKLVYGLGKRLGWRAYYIVLEEAWLRILNRRFAIPFAPLGTPQTYADGTRTLAAYASCEAMEQSMQGSAPAKYSWYQT